jgi:aromatic-L-amino-acid/L-tryptophan decarboxylase
MSASTTLRLEQGLDPPDWGELRQLGHQMIDDMFSYLESVGERPAWQSIPDQVKRTFAEPVPTEPETGAAVYRQFRECILPYPTGNIHPRFWSWVCGTGSAGGMLAELLSGAMNSSPHGGDHAAVYVERQVVSWLKQALGYPADASGLLVGGGSMANFVGLAVARNTKAGWSVKTDGLANGSGMLTVYCSTETHSSVVKAVELLGLGSNALRKIEADGDFRIPIDRLRDAVALDRARGKRPICVVANAGTVNSGAIDDLAALADFCQEQNLWLHVDGAFGAIPAISPKLRPLLQGMERADSLAFDLHKWMYMPYDVGCALVRFPEHHRETFAYSAAYLNSQNRGLAGGPEWFSHYGLELSRGFRALKVWFSLKEHGLKTYQTLVEQNVAQAQYLGELIAADRRLELLAPIPLNVVCFRYRGDVRDETLLKDLNQEILLRLQESGVAAPSATVIGGRFAIRAAICNHRSRREDFEILVREVVRLGDEISATFKRNSSRTTK